MIAKDSKETSKKVELRINRVRINRARSVIYLVYMVTRIIIKNKPLIIIQPLKQLD